LIKVGENSGGDNDREVNSERRESKRERSKWKPMEKCRTKTREANEK